MQRDVSGAAQVMPSDVQGHERSHLQSFEKARDMKLTEDASKPSSVRWGIKHDG